MTLLACWAFFTVATLLGLLIWAFVPILIPILLILAVLTVLVAFIVSLVRWVAPAGKTPLQSQQVTGELASRRSARRRSELPD